MVNKCIYVVPLKIQVKQTEKYHNTGTSNTMKYDVKVGTKNSSLLNE